MSRASITLAPMNWLDWTLIALIGFSAVRGFTRGFVVEVASLLALVLGIWAAVKFSGRVADYIGLSPDREVLAFFITFVAVLLTVHLVARVITKGMDMAMLGLPNKVAGTFFGALRSAFVLSVLMNVVMARLEKGGPIPQATLEESRLYGPVRAFAPFVVPALEETKWLHNALDLWDRHMQAE